MKDRDRPLPLPEGTFLYGFTSLRKGKGVRYAVLTDRNRIVYLDETGKELWVGLDAVTGTEITLEGTGRRLQVPGRMAAVDLDRDGTDELVVLNDLVAAGTYFENLRVFAQAEILCFAQGDTGLQLAWRSPQLDASARDLLADRSARTAIRYRRRLARPRQAPGRHHPVARPVGQVRCREVVSSPGFDNILA